MTRSDLVALLTVALEHAVVGDVQLAIRCMRLADASMDDVLDAALSRARLNRSCLRAAFEWGARFGMLAAIERLAGDSRPEVSYAVPFAIAEGRAVAHARAVGAVPADVVEFDARCREATLSAVEEQTASMIIDVRSASPDQIAALLLRHPQRLQLLGASAAADGLSLDQLLRAAEESTASPSEAFLRRLAAHGDPRVETALRDLAKRHGLGAVANGLAWHGTPGCIATLIDGLGLHSWFVGRALQQAKPDQVAAVLLSEFRTNGRFRRIGAGLMAEFCGEAAIPVLIEALADDFRDVREPAAMALAKLRVADEKRRIERPAGSHETHAAGAVLGGSPASASFDFPGSFGAVAESPRAPAPQPTPHPPPLRDSCYFSLTAPLQLVPTAPFIVDLWCHSQKPSAFALEHGVPRRGQAIRSVGPLPIERGTLLHVHLRLPGFEIDAPDAVMQWVGDTGTVSFAVATPATLAIGTYLGRAQLSIDGIVFATVHFQVAVGDATGPRADCVTSVRRINSAFASYASSDRDDVLARIQGMQKILPDLDVFLDVLSLRAGIAWKERLVEEIESRDTFFLFWSRSARASQWVDFEWRSALRARGPDFIDPVPLETPDLAPPPDELAQRHFGDWTLQLRSP